MVGRREISPTIPVALPSYASAESANGMAASGAAAEALGTPQSASSAFGGSDLDDSRATVGAGAVMHLQRASADAKRTQAKKLDHFVAQSAASIAARPRDRLAASSEGKRGPSMRGVLSLGNKEDSGGSSHRAGDYPSRDAAPSQQEGDRAGALGFLAQTRGAHRGTEESGSPLELEFRASHRKLLDLGKEAPMTHAERDGRPGGGGGSVDSVDGVQLAGDSVGSEGDLRRIGTAGDGLFSSSFMQRQGSSGSPHEIGEENKGSSSSAGSD